MAIKRLFALICYGLIFVATAVAWTGTTQTQEGSLSNVIEWPNEGETLYAGPSSLLYKVSIKGRVRSDLYPAEKITVELVIFKQGVPTGSLTATPDEDGYYLFYVTVNPEGSTQQFEIAFTDCGIACHSPAELDLQPGKLRLQVNASDPAGNQAMAERHISVDIAGLATVPVQVTLVGADNLPVGDVDVLASTRLYLWRSRFAGGRSDATGLAELRVEALAQAPTEYVFKVDPTIVDGVLYEGVDSIRLTLEPGVKNHPPIELRVTAQQGQITGRLSSPAGFSPSDTLIAGLPVWAIHLPAGSSFQTTTSDDGSFVFSELPLDQYLVTLDGNKLLQEGLVSTAEEIDLSELIQAEMDISLGLAEGSTLSGQVGDEDGGTLPFAWAMVEGITGWQAIMPGFDGHFKLTALPSTAVNAVFSAPGYYGRVLAIEPSSSGEIAVSLSRHKESTSRAWGTGEIFLPAGAGLREQNDALILDRGWFWGQSNDGDPLTLLVASTKISITEGHFALEHQPGKSAWLYLLQGDAQISRQDPDLPVSLHAGQMVNLLNDGPLEVVPLDPVVIGALESYRQVDVPLVWQPTLGAQIRDQITWIGVGTAQVVTFVTYFLLILSLILLPLLGLYWWWRRKKEPGATDQ